ncbi:MAG: MMPL family transporter [Elusimicrobiota bacterium]|nr:MMPL family transporter [Elusimicrobiota bacterium]
MKLDKGIIKFSMHNAKEIVWIVAVVTVFMVTLTALPTVWPQSFHFLKAMKVDTDPENMLPADEPIRLFHNSSKKEFALYDMLVVGVTNEKAANGVFNKESLENVFELAEFAKTLNWPAADSSQPSEGVISADIIAPSTVDSISQGSPGEVKFEWLMSEAPASEAEAMRIRKNAERIPFLNGTLISENGKAVCLYLPLTSKKVSYKVSSALQEKIKTLEGDDRYFITGLPVANDTFGVEMFKQMAVSAPMAMLVIFLLLLYFFKKLVLIISPMILALVSVAVTMGLLVITGNTIHIMSSMIPIFIMPIAVLNSVHILSEFFDRYPKLKDREKTLTEVMGELFMPMLYTSLTSMVGFLSLALTPIPPVQVFGIFIGLGIMFSWLLTITFIPAYIMLLQTSTLDNFGIKTTGGKRPAMARFISRTGLFSYYKSRWIVAGAMIVMLIAVYGMSKIQINDNPVKWFAPSHPIRVADKELNKHFGGTYMAYFQLEGVSADNEKLSVDYVKKLTVKSRLHRKHGGVPGIRKAFDETEKEIMKLSGVQTKKEFVDRLLDFADRKLEEASDDAYDAWDEVYSFAAKEKQSGDVFKNPEVLAYIGKLQAHMLTTGVVGKSNSIADIVKTVYRELLSGNGSHFSLPDSAEGVAQCLLTYQNSHRPQDLWHFVTPDYKKTSIWVQLKSGNNRDMLKVVDSMENFIVENPPPVKLTHKWFGLTYINVIWQNKMVKGMMKAFAGSFLVVFLMLTVEFRSALWGILAMIPLTVTIAFIYGIVGIAGKDYDMPIAILSSLTLGLAVDFAIHFLMRSRATKVGTMSWRNTTIKMFHEPARAISRNIIVIAVGFLPLLAAPLVPYKTVGVFLATILFVAGITTLLILPALMKIFAKQLFPHHTSRLFFCNRRACTVSSVTLAAVAVINFNLYQKIGFVQTGLLMFVFAGLSAFVCVKLSKKEKCKFRKKNRRKNR